LHVVLPLRSTERSDESAVRPARRDARERGSAAVGAPSNIRPRMILGAADPKLRRRLRLLFESSGYHVQTTVSPEETLLALEVSVPQLVVHCPPSVAVADPVIARLRAATRAALIVLTPAYGESPVVEALAAGADDAIPPPYARGELIARLELTMRRTRRAPARRIELRGNMVLDVEARQLSVAGQVVVLTRLEYRLLEELVVAGGNVVEHDELLTRVWGPAHRGRLHYLRVYVGRLRQKIDHAGAPDPITNLPGIGYRLDRDAL
jgi:two-component system KDP operon response regulator KdpE